MNEVAAHLYANVVLKDEHDEDPEEYLNEEQQVCFLYLLMRDELAAGIVARLIYESTEVDSGFKFSSPALAEHARLLLSRPLCGHHAPIGDSTCHLPVGHSGHHASKTEGWN